MQQNIFHSLKNRIKYSKFFTVFNFKNDTSKGLSCMLISGMMMTLATQLTSGLFYTGFLVGYGINSVNIGIVTFIPFLAKMTVIFAPYILEKFKKKKGILTFCKIMYYTISIVAFTIIPEVIKSDFWRVVAMIVINFIAQLFYVVATSGYNAWHASFLEGNEDKKIYYFTISQFISALFSGIMLLTTGIITDALNNTPYHLAIIVALRYLAFAIAIVDVIVSALPREYIDDKPVIKSKLSDIFRLPLKNKAYTLTMIIVFLWQFSNNTYLTFFDVYLLNDAGVSYSFYNLIIAIYPLFFILFSKTWQSIIHRHGSVNAYLYAMFAYFPTMIAYAFVNKENYLWLMLLTRIIQHVIGVGQNVCFANFQYLNMPKDNRVCYTSFYQLIFNMSAFLGLLAGTGFMKYFSDFKLSLSILCLSAPQILLIISAFIELMLVIYIFAVRGKIEPKKPIYNSVST